MTDQTPSTPDRRRFLKTISSAVLLAPLGGLVACSGEPEPTKPEPTKPAKPAAQPAPPQVSPSRPKPAAAEAPPPAPAAASSPAYANLPLLQESDPQAQALGYVSDAANADSARFPQFASGSRCENCALYQGKPGTEQGPCPIFAGRQVSAAGWCSAYSPKA